ncbi:hypothetical protein A2765_02875 [Candidatus Kaiserbacteria bacterium RIFCSPHIGHO2_01_FULL_56_24]|uniref:DUF218 domain-containing protein n=1 Tax=Candidatus Kaiserbacteria bacterium RIFCSPHIGHO2_01_FULL_56_24 TaxID=1798487 RepID=A0A1F6DCA3_9BACT|nr:MAG: hypothetical protein A2765_02875 [Candidatus Kaiserbacteria bacterium RIFCSPHIGHO2_01_FULL_56_24]
MTFRDSVPKLRPVIDKEIEMSSGIVAFAFGFPDTVVANLAIARLAYEEASRLSAPIYTQHEVHVHGAEYVDAPGPQGPIPTLRLCRAAVQWAHLRGLDEIVIGAAKPHLWRCIRDLEYAVQEVNFPIAVRASGYINKVAPEDWFRGDSQQWYTNNRLAWYLRDTILRIMPMFIYARIAS